VENLETIPASNKKVCTLGWGSLRRFQDLYNPLQYNVCKKKFLHTHTHTHTVFPKGSTLGVLEIVILLLKSTRPCHK
jgi:hypothetical protein